MPSFRRRPACLWGGAGGCWQGDGTGGGGGSVTGRGRESGCFTRPLTFTSPALQSAVSIKDGCCSDVAPIHHRRRGAADGRLGVMEGERVCREGRGGRGGGIRGREDAAEGGGKGFPLLQFFFLLLSSTNRKKRHLEKNICAEGWSCIYLSRNSLCTRLGRPSGGGRNANTNSSKQMQQNVSTATMKQLFDTFPHQSSAEHQHQAQTN